MKRKMIFTVALFCVLLYTPLSVFSQDFEMNGTVLVKYNGNAASVTIPTGVTSIGYGAFAMIDSLTSITIPNSVTSIGDFAFSDCTRLTNITFTAGSQLQTIGEGAFNDTGITSITLPNNLTSIGEGAFYGSTSLTSITIPASVTEIGRNAFGSINTINVDRGNITFAVQDGILYNKVRNEIISIARSINGSVTIPAGITSISGFSYRTGITGITIPVSVTEIGEWAFNGCTGLTSVTFATGSQLRTIGRSAFDGCTSLYSINIPNSVTSVGNEAFKDTAWLNSQNGLVYVGKVLYKYKGTIPANTVINNMRTDTTAILDYAFYYNYGDEDCRRLAGITIPASVTSIGKNAFSECSFLTSVTFAAGSNITSDNFSSFAFPGSYENLKNAYLVDGAGRYTRATFMSDVWTKQ